MQVIDSECAAQLLVPIGIRIGEWNELRPLLPSAISHRSYAPPAGALELYVMAYRLAQWINSGAWTLLQVDNSTLPTDDEVGVFEAIAFDGQTFWDVATQHTFLLQGQQRLSTLALLIHFTLLFEWHVHLVSEGSLEGQRLALQDGLVYFFGGADALQSADGLITSLVAEPRKLWQ